MPLRSTFAGAATGVVLLGAVFGFAVGLPKWTGDEATADSDQPEVDTTPVADLLPDTLLNGAMVPLSAVKPDLKSIADKVEGYGGDKLTDAFGTDVAVAIYVTPDLKAQAALTIYDGESGLFLQQGPPVPPEASANSQTESDVLKVGESVCIAQWQAGGEAKNQPPFQVQCQRVVDGRTINVYAAPGITPEQGAQIIDDVVQQDGLG